MSRLRNLLALLSVGMLFSMTPALAQSPKPPPFRPPGPRPNAPSPKPPPFRPKPPPVQPVPPVIVAPGNPGNVKPPPEDEQQRRRRLFFILMLRQQALTRAALQQAALASAFANQLPYQTAVPSYSMQMYYSPPSYPPPPAPAARQQPPVAELALLAGIVGADGKVAWPLGLQIARPALETKTLRERIDGLVRMAAKQAAYGQVQGGILDEVKQLLADLRKAFENSRQDMPERTARDADAFLARLDSSLQSMQGDARAAPNDGAGKKKY